MGIEEFAMLRKQSSFCVWIEVYFAHCEKSLGVWWNTF